MYYIHCFDIGLVMGSSTMGLFHKYLINQKFCWFMILVLQTDFTVIIQQWTGHSRLLKNSVESGDLFLFVLYWMVNREFGSKITKTMSVSTRIDWERNYLKKPNQFLVKWNPGRYSVMSYVIRFMSKLHLSVLGKSANHRAL